MRSTVLAAGTAALSALALSLLAVSGPAPAAPPAVSLVATTTATPAQQVLALVNTERAKAGCEAVRLESRLSAAATKYSQSMARNDFFSHVGPDDSNFVARVKREGYPTPRSENIAAGNATAQETMRQWMNSSGHRRNILDCTATEMGLGVASSNDSRFGIYWTQVFGLGDR